MSGLAALAVAALGAPEPDAVVAPPQPGGDEEVLPIAHRKDLMLVDVNIASQGPFPFMVDSGSERTVIATEVASQLALQPGKSVVVHSMTEAQTIATAHIPQLRFSRRLVSDIHAPSLPAKHIGAAGVLGIDSLNKQRVTFDFENSTMTIAASSQSDNERWASDTVLVIGRTLYGRLVLTDVIIDGERVLAIVDTGSPVTIGNEALRAKLAARRPPAPRPPLELISITGGTKLVDYATVRRIQIGNMSILGMPIGFADVHVFRYLQLTKRPAILLGMDAMRQFSRVSVDFGRKQVRFEIPPAQLAPQRTAGN